MIDTRDYGWLALFILVSRLFSSMIELGMVSCICEGINGLSLEALGGDAQMELGALVLPGIRLRKMIANSFQLTK